MYRADIDSTVSDELLACERLCFMKILYAVGVLQDDLKLLVIVFFIFQERLTLLVGWFPLPGNILSPQEVLKEEAWLPPL